MISKEEIQQQAKDILDRFSKALEKVNVEETKVEREEDRRKEGKEKAFIDNRIMFSNAPKTKDNCIEAEKGAWV